MSQFPEIAPKAVIFDMDGTTVQHLSEWKINLAERLDDMIYFVRNKCACICGKSKNSKEILDEVKADAAHKEPKLYGHKLLHSWRRIRRKGVETVVEPSPNVIDILETLKAHKIPTGLASNGLGKGYGHDVLEAFELGEYFQSTIFREDIKKSKPAPEGIFKTIQKLDLDISDTDVIWYIGDRTKDIEAAMAANEAVSYTIVPIAYKYSAGLAALTAGLNWDDHVISDYKSLNERLQKMLKKKKAA